MRHSQRPLFKKNESTHFNGPALFSIFSIIPQIIIIAIVIGAYYYIVVNEYFPLWLNTIYWAVKIIIALEMIIAAARSLILSFVAIAFAGVVLYLAQKGETLFISVNDAWQLLIIGAVGLVITFIVRSLRRR